MRNNTHLECVANKYTSDSASAPIKRRRILRVFQVRHPDTFHKPSEITTTLIIVLSVTFACLSEIKLRPGDRSESPQLVILWHRVEPGSQEGRPDRI